MEGVIFKDKSKLLPSYIPTTLPHREEQKKLIHTFLDDSLLDVPSQHMRILQLIGAVGTGKTCTSINFLNEFNEEARLLGVNLRTVYLNLKVLGSSPVALYRALTRKAAPEIYSASLGSSEILFNLVRFLSDKKRYLLMVLDEIGYLVKSGGKNVIYDLTRLNEIEPREPSNILGVIFIARSKDFHKSLGKAELSSLGRCCIEFPNYSSKQLFDILSLRVKEAFNPGSVDEEIIGYVADVTSQPPINGDVRYALDILLYAGTLAETQGYDKLLPEHVRRVHGETHYLINTEEIMTLPYLEKVVLLSIARALKNKMSPYASLSEIRKAYFIVCEEYGLRKKEEIEEEIQDLCDRGLIDIKSLTKIGVSGVETAKLEKFIGSLIDRLGKEIK